MGILFTNNASTVIIAGISAIATSLSVTAGTGALFPSLSGVDYFYCSLIEGLTIEIVKVTARSTDTFTIERAQEGTSASAFNTGANVELRLTKQGLADLTHIQHVNAFKGGII